MANLFNKFNQKYGSIDKKAIVRKILKGAIKAGDAVVDVLKATGIAGFKFHIPETEVVKFASDVTDHYTDINTPVQDHIALKPITITVTGLVGDYFYSIHQIEDYIAMITPTLRLIQEFMNQENPIVKQIKSKWDTAWNNFMYPISPLAVDYGEQATTKVLSGSAVIEDEKTKWSMNGMDVFSLFQQLYKIKSAQTRAFLFFEALWRAGEKFSVETTWKRFDNMVIINLEPKRDNNADITEFSITFKQMDGTQSKIETPEEYANRRSQQLAESVDKGETKGEKISVLDEVQYA